MRRTTGGFSDGRIHVTLCDGAFDLALLCDGDRALYDGLLERFGAGCALEVLESLAGLDCGELWWARLRVARNGVLLALYSDLCRRVALEAAGQSGVIEEIKPWRRAESKELVESLVNWRPAGVLRSAAPMRVAA